MEKISSLIDKTDIKILRELDRNSRIPLTQLAKKIHISREVIKYHLKKLVDSRIIKSFTTMINPAKFGLIIYKVYFKTINLSVEKEKQLLDFMKKTKEVFWLAKTNGSFDFIAGIYVKNILEFDNFLNTLMENFGKYISSRHISNTVYAVSFLKKYLDEKSKTYEEYFWGGIPDKEKADSVEISILKLIAENSRISIAEICEKINASPKTVISKIKSMKKKKIILEYRIILNLEKINKEYFKAIIYFQNINKKRVEEFKKFCKENPFVTYYIKTLGEWDVELDIEIENYKELNNLFRNIKTQFGDIIKLIDFVYISEELKGELNVVQNL